VYEILSSDSSMSVTPTVAIAALCLSKHSLVFCEAHVVESEYRDFSQFFDRLFVLHYSEEVQRKP